VEMIDGTLNILKIVMYVSPFDKRTLTTQIRLLSRGASRFANIFASSLDMLPFFLK
jgi:hypothetical protein